ncbi:MAG: bifunctional demethylmenaquinone methyltransferase/2-methoxy-6-polyprenyl-1,4-benzoquinol methylase UbiE [Saprospiraceae bacterium]|jgi:demethylmenaquinone methyltransferase / 2-methoxy-6-polyprenyl-1,4-benzoquinol methylase|nr:bifunctional demethylmenaquinone methyltransferase/2-methoxy-6-polyprenyl-1,4-benzoquinol methylase UbiE [Saprospiraceae bacterium]MDP4821048.1 bifunctional demethylmenaquinone methyltransferase/2-methoxy-6-polyprenyl-1,4-benzoquinol methylase UbiE [Saprospiraceae bacterium]MDP4998299.1 bifunctional demethylmenaquinone methyltransferase/2-methoxy-6-polyprenyl-1,4-benzoquinol methylase UbiE [Saprospiraceae bacterium]
MEIKPYDNDASGKKSQVSKMFNNIAPYYDLLNRVLSLGIDTVWRKKAVQQLSTGDRPQIILDVATGTADLALEINRQLNPHAITGVDIAADMLAIGRQKIAKQNLSEIIRLEQGDSEELRFENDYFDAITVAFGVRNFENLQKGLTEMRRVLKPGGKAVILEFSKPTIFPFKQLYHFYFKNILPFIGKFTSRDPKAYQYLYESVQSFPDGERFTAILSNVGFKSTKCIPLTLGICSIYVAEK